VYGRFRARWWLPTALWRTAEFCRLHHLTAAPPILDLGCGDGFFARQALARNLHAKIVGADRDLHELQALVHRERGGRAVCAEARALPFRSQAFGTVLANCALEHVEEIEAAMREIARVLQPGGRLVFTVPSEHFGRLLHVSELLTRCGLKSLADGYARLVNRAFGHRTLLTPDEWRRRIEAAGLRLERMEYYMPAPLARAWDRRIWLGLPWLALERLWGRHRERRPRLRRLPESFQRLLSESCSEGAGAIYHCVK
jgi:SAM-dependent methyltransferase